MRCWMLEPWERHVPEQKPPANHTPCHGLNPNAFIYLYAIDWHQSARWSVCRSWHGDVCVAQARFVYPQRSAFWPTQPQSLLPTMRDEAEIREQEIKGGRRLPLTGVTGPHRVCGGDDVVELTTAVPTRRFCNRLYFDLYWYLVSTALNNCRACVARATLCNRSLNPGRSRVWVCWY
jgi:hypothetical protein